jgi:A/G-specific adenine glycosylase
VNSATQPAKNLRAPKHLRSFRHALLAWFDRSQRRLPWRTKKPVAYRVWISEIMLQQTRVAVVAGYYRRFLRQFPNVTALASAREQKVLAAWSGLGYYRRARMLHQAAKQIVQEQRGSFPSTSSELRLLPGVGRYTAAAVASIAFGEVSAVVDGNVERVLDRLMKKPSGTKFDHWSAAQQLLSTNRPGDFNQAMMELGATVCLPRNPICNACPIASWCGTRGHGEKTKSKRRRTAQLNYLLSVRGNQVALVQRRHEASLMAGMWELPSVTHPSSDALMRLKHSITHTDYSVGVFSGAPDTPVRWVPTGKLELLPLTGLTRKILQRAGLFNIKKDAVIRDHSRRRSIHART